MMQIDHSSDFLGNNCGCLLQLYLTDGTSGDYIAINRRWGMTSRGLSRSSEAPCGCGWSALARSAV